MHVSIKYLYIIYLYKINILYEYKMYTRVNISLIREFVCIYIYIIIIDSTKHMYYVKKKTLILHNMIRHLSLDSPSFILHYDYFTFSLHFSKCLYYWYKL